MKSTQGFTLIELMIVISIIGILVAVLIPSILASQKRAYDVSAASCAQSLIRAVYTYRVDHPTTANIPALTTFYGTSTAEEEYGTDNCHNLTLQDLSQPSIYTFTIFHPQGRNVYTVDSSGITKAAKP